MLTELLLITKRLGSRSLEWLNQYVVESVTLWFTKLSLMSCST